MTQYAGVETVLSRAGRLRSSWDDSTSPSISDIREYLKGASGRVDALLGARGIALPVDAVAKLALRDLVADMALQTALAATFTSRGESAPDAGAKLLEQVQLRVDDGLAALQAGTHEAVLYLESGGATPSASTFQMDHPEYGRFPAFVEPTGYTFNPALDPPIRRDEIG